MKTRKKAIRPMGAILFRINFGSGKIKELAGKERQGYFIKEASKARNLVELNEVIGDEGLTLKAVRSLVEFLGYSQDQFASIIGFSTRTVSRWADDAHIGVLGSKALIDMDELIGYGIDVMGDQASFKQWLDQPNQALGDLRPIELLLKPYGVALVHDAVEALEFGNVM
ncbi:MAG TPA: antitoxin Xre/MbcA/ParS toxin-binding domain-containing protein [Ohtaekwangia sp.]